MTDTRALTPLSPSLTASVLLHASIFMLLLPNTGFLPIPEGRYLKGGAEVVELGVLESSHPEITLPDLAASLKKKKKTRRPKPEAAEPMVKSESQQIGHADGQAGRGQLGDPNGIAGTVRERYLYELSVLLNARKSYPIAARRLGETGRITLRFIVLRDGRVENPEILTPSLSDRLNRAALELVAGVGRFKPPPPEILASASEARGLAVEVPVEYVLN